MNFSSSTLKTFFTKLLLVLIAVMGTTTLYSQNHDHSYSCKSKHHLTSKKMTQMEKQLLDDSSARSDTFDIEHYDIHIDITDYFGQTIDCHTTLSITALMDDLEDIRLDLMDLTVDSVKVDGVSSPFSHEGETLEVLFPTSLSTDDEILIDVWYNGHPYQDPQWGGFYFESNYVYNLGVGLSTIPPNFGRVWYPCFDTYVERATYDWHVTSANGHVPHCQGELISEIALEGDTLTRHYALDIPVPTYLTAIAASNYVTIEYDHEGAYGSIPVKLHAKNGQQSNMETRFANLPAAIDALEYWYGPYIWNKVGYVMTTVGAMEHPTNIAYPQGMMNVNNIANEGLFSHELGHLWWGDIVTPESYNHMWLKEGNAEYCQHLMREWLSGEDPFVKEVKDNHLFVLESAHTDDGGYFPLSPMPDETIYGTHSYNKGASVIHNLRAYMGDSLFRQGMQAVLDTFYLSYMDPEDFKSVLSSSTEVDLTSFFNDQVYSPGFSAFELDSVVSTQSGGTWTHNLFFEQKLRECPNYYTNVPIEISFLDENWEKHTSTVMLSGELDQANLETDFEPLMTMVNSNGRLNQAKMDFEEVYFETGITLVLPWVDFKLKVEEIAENDSAYFRGEHYWIKPDDNLLGEGILHISDAHYYKVDGQWSESTRLTARFDYSAVFSHYIDYDLVALGSEEQLGLVYRSDAAQPWEIYENTTMQGVGGGNGTAKADSLLKGQYAFAILEPLVGIEELASFEVDVFPIPASEACSVILNSGGMYEISLVDNSGRLVWNLERLFTTGVPEAFNLSSLSKGNYTLQVRRAKETSVIQKSLIIE